MSERITGHADRFYTINGISEKIQTVYYWSGFIWKRTERSSELDSDLDTVIESSCFAIFNVRASKIERLA